MIEQLTIDSFSATVTALNTEPETATEAIERADANADPLWKAEALRIVENLCKSRKSFDLDDVAVSVPETREPRAIGQTMRLAKANNWCRQTGVKNSVRPSRHGGYIAVYESLIFSGV